MDEDINLVVLEGTLKEEPTMLTNEYGTIMVIHLETKKSWKDKVTGETETKIEIHPIVIFNPNTIDYVNKYIKLGDRLFVKGIMQSRTYKTDKGETRYSSRMAVGKVEGHLKYIGRPKKAASDTAQPEADRGARSKGPSLSDDDIPY